MLKTRYLPRFSVSSGEEDGEVALFGQIAGMFLTIEADGTIGASVSRRALLCEKLQEGTPQPDFPQEPPEEDGLRQRRPVPDAPEAAPDNEKAPEPEAEKKAELSPEPNSFEDAGGSNEALDPEAFWAKELQNAPVFELSFPPLHPMDAYLTHEACSQLEAWEHLLFLKVAGCLSVIGLGNEP